MFTGYRRIVAGGFGQVAVAIGCVLRRFGFVQPSRTQTIHHYSRSMSYKNTLASVMQLV